MIFNNDVIQSLGMTLIHSLWQGIVVLVLVMFTLLLAGKSNARIRYAVLVSGLMLLLAGFIATWCTLCFRIYHQSTALNYGSLVYEQIPWFENSHFRMTGTTSSFSVHRFQELSYPILAMGWILGFLFMSVRTTGALYLSHRIFKRDVFQPDPFLQNIFMKAGNRMMMPAMIQLRLTARKISPMVIGLLKPVVILPASILSGLNAEQVEAILIHELAHIRRHDHLVMIIQSVATQVLFFHPLTWFLSAEINHERENCCDDMVMKIFPNPINYIKALTMIQELHILGPIPANALMGRTKRLLSRITRILKPETNQTPAYRFALVFMLLITLGIAAATIATTGNSGSKKSMALVFSDQAEKPVAIPDTSKEKVERKAMKQREFVVQEDKKKEKEIDDARNNLEKAEQELEKVREEMEKARQEVERAQEELKELDPTALHPEIIPIVPGLPDWEDFRFAFKYDGHEHWRNLQEELSRARETMQHIRQEDLDRLREEWERSGEQRKEMRDALNRAREEMMRNRRQFREQDWEKYREEWHRLFPLPPFPGYYPPLPPQIPHMTLPELPDPETLQPKGSLDDLDPLETNPDEQEKSATLDSKLREVEEGNE